MRSPTYVLVERACAWVILAIVAVIIISAI